MTQKIRLIGVGTSGFSSVTVPVQVGLFDRDEEIENEWQKVDQTLDTITRKFGKDAVKRATLSDQ
jgi:shikimate kinase